jgi:aminoglycoside 6'-N-acetyltransferase
MTACEFYEFRAFSEADFPMIRTWLALPHVTEWWGDTDEQFALVSGDLTHPDMDQYLVSAAGRPFAYLQCYKLSTWNQGFGAHPRGTRGIDQFIAEPDMVGCGHGSALIRQFVGGLFASNIPRVVTDPDPDNVRAVRAYEKAGFRPKRMVDTPDGPALLMVCNP